MNGSLIAFPGRALRALLLVALTLLLAPVSAASAGDWTVGEITGPAGTTRMIPAAVNADGVVVGTARFAGRGDDTAFRWENGTMIELALPAGMTYSRAKDINDAGVIVGWGGMYHDCCATSYNAIVWQATTTTSSFSLPDFNFYTGPFTTTGPEKTYGSNASSINEKGQIAGRAGYKGDDPTFGIWRNYMPATTGGGGWSRLPLPDTASTTYAGGTKSINEDGVILGSGGPGGDLPACGTPSRRTRSRSSRATRGSTTSTTSSARPSAPTRIARACGTGPATSRSVPTSRSRWPTPSMTPTGPSGAPGPRATRTS